MRMGTTSSTSTAAITRQHEMSAWQRWLLHPENLWVHRALFQIHMWLGMVAGLYLLVMSLSGSMIVFRDQLESDNFNSPRFRTVEWIVNLHENLLSGQTGRRLNGMGAIALTGLCFTGAVIWWPGIQHWRRSLSVNRRSSFARINWDLHNMLGFWCFLFLAMWGLSGIYFAFPEMAYPLFDSLDRSSTSVTLRFANQALLSVTNLHFGRFGLVAESVWTLVGLVPAVLVFTGMFMCCHRLLVRKGAPLPK